LANENMAFTGIGNMAGPMARNILKKGYGSKVFDISWRSMEDAIAAGASAASSAQAAARDVEVGITMLPSGIHVREIYL